MMINRCIDENASRKAGTDLVEHKVVFRGAEDDGAVVVILVHCLVSRHTLAILSK